MVTMIVNGKKAVRRICRQCIGRMQRGDAYAAQMALLSSFEPPEQEIYCPVCNTAWSDVLRRGYVGCPGCYQAFEEQLEPLLTQINGVSIQQPQELQEPHEEEDEKQRQIGKLREEMFSAVSAEEYERAAQLRDRIRILEREAGESGE